MDQRFRSARLPMAIVCAMACTAFVVGARTAAAQDVTTAVEAPNVGVLGTYVKADDVRGVDEGQGIQVAGHTDDRGGESYNFELSRRRAQSVAEYLSGVGIESSRMEARGYGESQPMDSNSTDTGRERNRRVEFRVLSN